MTKLTLISFPTCPYVQRAMIVLAEKAVDFDIVYVDLANRPDWFLAMSPLGKVPVLKVEREGAPDAVIFESLVIVEFLEETAGGPPLHPADPVEKARHRSWMEFAAGLQGDLHRFAVAVGEAAIAEAHAVVAKKLGQLEAIITGPLFAGEAFRCIDAVYAPAFRQMDAMERLAGKAFFPGLPRLDAWRRALAARASVIDAVPADWNERYVKRMRDLGAHFLIPAA